jgi:Fe-S-cluster containining protein
MAEIPVAGADQVIGIRPLYPVPSGRQTAYSYQCNACNRCCHDKLIQVNPYEAARLAQHLGVTTGEFIRDCLEDNVYLKRVPDGTCLFLTASGCGVHPHRPMVCRVYPLGRHVSGSGEETFSHLTPHPQTSGRYGEAGVVDDYLRQQRAFPYMAAADRYLDLFHRLHAVLRSLVDSGSGATAAALEASRDARSTLPEWLDVDRVVSSYAEAHGLPQPRDVDGKIDLHIAAIEAWLAALSETND